MPDTLLEQYAIVSPKAGIKTDAPKALLADEFAADNENVWVHNERIDRARLRLKEFSAVLPDAINGLDYFIKKNLIPYLMVMTKRDICYRDDANDRFKYITPQYAVGVIRVESASTKVYGGLNVDDCDDNPVQWEDRSGGDVTPSRETVIVKENGVSVKLAVADGAGVEELASRDNAGGVDLSTYDSIGFWFRSSVALEAADLTFKLNDAVDFGGADQEDINFPEIAANTWTWVNLTLVDPSNCDAIKSWGIAQAVDKGAMDLYIDQIVAGDWAGQLKATDFITIGATYTTADTWYEISVVNSDTELTLTAVYAEATAYQQTYLARVTFAGETTDLWEFDTCSEDEWLATNNGVDYPVNWAGPTDTTVANITTLFKAKHLKCWEGYTIWGNLVGSPQQERWSGLDDFDEYTAGVLGSGAADIYGQDELRGFGKWQDYLVVFKDASIHLQWTVVTDDIFQMTRKVNGIGCKAAKSIIEYGNKVYFWSSDNKFRAFNGLHVNEDLSKDIDDLVTQISPNYETGIAGWFSEELKQLWWAIPKSAESTANDRVMVHGLDTRDWSKLDLSIVCFGSYVTEAAMTWNTLPWPTWDEWGGRWDDRHFETNAPIDLGGCSDGYIYRVNGSEQDNGSDFTGYFELNQNGFGKLNIRKRLLEKILYFHKEVGGTINVALRIDDKASLETAVSKNLDDQPDQDLQEVIIPCDHGGKTFGLYVSAENPFRFMGVLYRFKSIGDR